MKEITYAQAINEAISEEMRRDENVFMMGEDIGLYCGAFGVSRGMIQEFGGDRIMDTPIAEQAYPLQSHFGGGNLPHRSENRSRGKKPAVTL